MSVSKVSIIIHGGAGPDSDFIRNNRKGYQDGLLAAMEAGYQILEHGGTAIDAVEIAIRHMEDDPLFNAGRGAAINAEGGVNLYASVMDGRSLKSGAACLLTNVKNPISFAKRILLDGKSVFVGGSHAVKMAGEMNVEMEPLSYFVTDNMVNEYLLARKEFMERNLPFNPAGHGTVGAVACDLWGNLAAGTSTGGTIYGQPGRIGDTSMIGVGTYACNQHCAVSCTGDGESLIAHVLAHKIYSAVEYCSIPVMEACETVINKKLKHVRGNMGAISIDKLGNIGFAFNSERMHRAWKTTGRSPEVRIYRTDGIQFEQ